MNYKRAMLLSSLKRNNATDGRTQEDRTLSI